MTREQAMAKAKADIADWLERAPKQNPSAPPNVEDLIAAYRRVLIEADRDMMAGRMRANVVESVAAVSVVMLAEVLFQDAYQRAKN